MKKRKKIGVVITDGVGYRNFVLTTFLRELSLKFSEVTIYSCLPKESFKKIELNENVQLIELEVFKESKINWIFRKLKEVAHMYLHRNYYGINDNLIKGYPKVNNLRGIQIKLIYLIANFFHKERHIQKYEQWQFKSFKKSSITRGYIKLLKEDQPDLLFFTHQRPPYLAPLLFAAQENNIPVTAFIFSWDNLPSKGRMLGEFDGYLVWSELMKKDLLHFYPTTIEHNVHVVGTPQFEPYVMDEYKMTKDEFCQKFNLNSTNKIICYSCADAGIGGNDTTHIESIINYINTFDKSIQLLVRTSPAEDGKRFNDLKLKYPFIIWNHPKWNLERSNHIESWSQRVPTKEDINDLKAILKFSDLNINMCSTMSMDFMLFDKPVINTVFGNEANGLYDDQRFLKFEHYKKVIESGAVTIVKNEVELHKAINIYLNNPAQNNKKRKALLSLQIGCELKESSTKVVDSLEYFINEK